MGDSSQFHPGKPAVPESSCASRSISCGQFGPGKPAVPESSCASRSISCWKLQPIWPRKASGPRIKLCIPEHFLLEVAANLAQESQRSQNQAVHPGAFPVGNCSQFGPGKPAVPESSCASLTYSQRSLQSLPALFIIYFGQDSINALWPTPHIIIIKESHEHFTDVIQL